MKVKPNVIRAGILKSCCSIQALSEKAGVSTRTVRRALRGERINLEQLGRILNALNIAPEDAIEPEVEK